MISYFMQVGRRIFFGPLLYLSYAFTDTCSHAFVAEMVGALQSLQKSIWETNVFLCLSIFIAGFRQIPSIFEITFVQDLMASQMGQS